MSAPTHHEAHDYHSQIRSQQLTSPYYMEDMTYKLARRELLPGELQGDGKNAMKRLSCGVCRVGELGW